MGEECALYMMRPEIMVTISVRTVMETVDAKNAEELAFS